MLDHRHGEISLAHRTHSRTRHTSTVRLAPWDAWFHGNCHEHKGATARSERRVTSVKLGFLLVERRGGTGELGAYPTASRILAARVAAYLRFCVQQISTLFLILPIFPDLLET
jgi:hypothetical protein